MPFSRPIPLVGQAYKHRDADVSAQTCKNYWPEFNKEANKIITLQPFPGCKASGTGSGEDGGMHTFKNVLYKVVDTTLYSEDNVGNRTSIGTIAGTGLCSFDDNGIEMIIVRQGNVYSYDGTTLTTATNSGFESPKYVTVLNSQAIYPGANRRFIVSNAGVSVGDLITLNALNYASKGRKGDDLVRPYVFKERIYLFGNKTFEKWWNSGIGNPPVDPIQNGLTKSGLIAPWSIGSNDSTLYYLSNDFTVRAIRGDQLSQPITTIPLVQEFKSYGTVADAIGFCLEFDDQHFYYLSFPSARKTWCYCQESNGWFELTTTNQEVGYRATSYAQAYGRQYIAIGGNTYYLDSNTYKNGTETIIRERVSQTIHAGLYAQGMEGSRLSMVSLEIVIKTKGLTTGQGSSPTVMVSYSDDNGRHWSAERFLPGQKLGKYTWRVRTDQLGEFYERVIRVRVSDPVSNSIQSAKATFEMSMD
jgi:hypothetical protein